TVAPVTAQTTALASPSARAQTEPPDPSGSAPQTNSAVAPPAPRPDQALSANAPAAAATTPPADRASIQSPPAPAKLAAHVQHPPIPSHASARPPNAADPECSPACGFPCDHHKRLSHFSDAISIPFDHRLFRSSNDDLLNRHKPLGRNDLSASL